VLSVSIITNYINILHADGFQSVEPFRESLRTWLAQTQQPIEILVADSSKPGPERDAVKDMIAEVDPEGLVKMVEFPFNYYTSYQAIATNTIAGMAKGDAILWLCPMWWLRENTWIQRMAQRLEEYGPNFILATENDRWHPNNPTKRQFEGRPTIFPAPDYSYVDNPKAMFYRSAWIPLDVAFDPLPDNIDQSQANAHGIPYWGWEQMHKYGRGILLCRDFKMKHAPKHEFQGTDHGIGAVHWSEKILHSKGL
jgi:hypothetical protein